MNSQSHTLPLSVTEAAPAARRSLGRTLDRVWNFLTELGVLRARSELLRLAGVYESTRPELAAQMRKAAYNCWL